MNVHLEDVKCLPGVKLGFPVVTERDGKVISPAERFHTFGFVWTEMKIERGGESITAAVFVPISIDEPEGHSLRCWIKIKQPAPNGPR
jgi:hypothetical protein